MSNPGDRVAAVRRLIAEQPPRPGGQGLLQRVCRAAAGALTASGAGVSVMTADGTRGISAASDPASEHVEELQFVLGEGPCIDAFTTARPVLVANLADGATRRWPAYAPLAQEGGLRAVFAFPLQIGAARLGVLDVYRDRAGALTSDEIACALTFADVIVDVLLDRHPDAGTPDATDAVAYRAELFQAQGMVMVQLGVAIDEAMARLRARAYAEDRPLGDVARDVVAGRLQLDPDLP
ncbi:GAF and ANTAR domain-containing protein [Spirilliplanes yamanashiensis]|uniref:GAF domain-containing protein n=1 Tax=Spirilliplanes yamanashiensis TaxID=42233 RepID=A0A8J4DJD4_9ACTN|nr:GAF and ANTAR domain-containing protein [Spirilliplanes yamanashiensis]MDP9817228.1 signal transduction protein with GAF and PtsI domain [Spirilliplanes yamanashiensis]GIJ03118.1 GAF domain-containing protein [Spirilliplanes yamanashiensis]